MNNFWEKLEWRKAELHLTWKQLAARIGVTDSRLRYIRLAKSIEFETLERLSAALEWPVGRWRRRLAVPQSPLRATLKAFEAEAARRVKKPTPEKKTGT